MINTQDTTLNLALWKSRNMPEVHEMSFQYLHVLGVFLGSQNFQCYNYSNYSILWDSQAGDAPVYVSSNNTESFLFDTLDRPFHYCIIRLNHGMEFC